MSEIELNTREETKAMHETIRKDMKKASLHQLRFAHAGCSYTSNITHREMLLIWAFMRGFKFRRIERTHRMQDGKEILSMYANWLAGIWVHYFPKSDKNVQQKKFQEWLDDPSGAIPVTPREKRPYVAPVAKTG